VSWAFEVVVDVLGFQVTRTPLCLLSLSSPIIPAATTQHLLIFVLGSVLNTCCIQVSICPKVIVYKEKKETNKVLAVEKVLSAETKERTKRK
jgi:hypothetical protein